MKRATFVMLGLTWAGCTARQPGPEPETDPSSGETAIDPVAPGDPEPYWDTGTGQEPPACALTEGCRATTTAWDHYVNIGNAHVADGVTDNVLRTTFDALGTRVTELHDDGNDGVPDACIAWFPTYDSRGWLVALETDYSTDGQLDVAVRFEHDDAGRVLVRAENLDAVGGDERVAALAYDADGRLLTEEVDGYDTYDYSVGSYNVPPDGLADFRTSFGYDPSGRLVLVEVDGLGINGTPDEVTVWTYDERGSVASEVVDSCPSLADASCLVTHEHTWTYDAEGLPTAEVEVRLDWMGTWTFTRTYATSGELLTEVLAESANPNITAYIATFSYLDECP